RLARPEATDSAVNAAVRSAGLGGLIARLPLGLETPVGDDGVRLSGGQRQLVAIARAFLADARLVIIDEATSQLDRDSEAVIRDARVQRARDGAVVVVSPGRALAAAADEVAVVVSGRIVEVGPPAELATHARS